LLFVLLIITAQAAKFGGLDDSELVLMVKNVSHDIF